MPFIDTLLDDIASSAHLPAEAKTLAQQFITANRDWFERLGPTILKNAFSELLQGKIATAWDTLTGAMSQDELAALLNSTSQEFDHAADQRTQALAAFTQFKTSLGEAALSFILHAL